MMGRTKIAAGLGALALGLALHAAAQGDIYRWTDKDGQVHFTDTPPPGDATSVTQKRMGSSVSDPRAIPYATQVAMKRHPVTLYVADKCAPCDKARQLLHGRGIPYTERNAQGNAQEVEAVKKIAGSAEVPLLLVGDKTIKGYEEATWTTALDDAGYPRALLPGQVAPEPERIGGPTAAQGGTANAR